MDFSKLKNNKTLQIALIIAVPTVIVAGYFGYKFIKRKIDERNEDKFILEMREKYKNISNVNDFIEGVKYLKQSNQFGYDFKKLDKYKDYLSSIDFEEIKEIYELLKNPIQDRSDDENDKIVNFLDSLKV